MSKLKLDLHPIYNNREKIIKEIVDSVRFAHENGIKTLEIIPGKGSGQLKKTVLRILETKELKALYHRIDKDSRNFGRIFVYFKK